MCSSDLMPKDPVYVLDKAYTGMGVGEKLAAIRSVMAKVGADVHVCNVLDDIAWTLNVRGGDVLNTPVVMSYLSVSMEDRPHVGYGFL